MAKQLCYHKKNDIIFLVGDFMKQRRKVIIYSLFLSFIFLWIGTKSSPIYPMNDWVDANAFFTMGKGLINGLTPFKDLFEQKGPILYFLYGIGYLISNKTFLGIYLLEVVSFTISLVYFYKILKLYDREKQFYLAAPFLLAILLTMPAFTHGGGCEELLLPCFFISFYHFIYLIKDKNYLKVDTKLYFIEGILVGIILWTKFILLGFWIGWVIFIGILLLISKKYKKIFSIILSYLLGIIAVTIPVLLYFWITGALLDLWNTYFYLNIFLYPASESLVPIQERISLLGKIFCENMNTNSIYMFTLIIGFISVLRDRKVIKKWMKIGIIVLFIFTFFFNYIGLKSHLYYFFVLSPFAILFGIFVANLCEKIEIPSRYLAILLVPLLWVFVYALSPNTYFLGTKKENLAQYIFADIMNQKENPTLLYYGNIDGGFYTVADILPTEKYFEKVNIEYSAFPDNVDAQDMAIKEEKVDFVIMRIREERNSYSIGVPYLYENYQIVKEVPQEFEGINFKYILFQKRSSL